MHKLVCGGSQGGAGGGARMGAALFFGPVSAGIRRDQFMDVIVNH